MTARPVVDLPQPDSPTSPRVSPSHHVEADARDRVDSRPVLPSGNSTTRLLDAQQRLARVAQMGGAASGHQASSPAAGGGRGGRARCRRCRGRRGAAAARLRASASCPRACPRGPARGSVARDLGLCSGGSSSWHRSCAYAHRGLNRHPFGGLIRSGGRPAMTSRRVWLRLSSFGIDFSSASV